MTHELHEQIEGFAALFGTAPRLTEIEIRHEGGLLRLRRNAHASPSMPLSSPTSPASHSNPLTLKSPSSSTLCLTAEHVGVIHLSTVTPGERVKAGQVLAQIDTMRLLSDCKAPVAGTLSSLLVENGQPVEYGQPLFEISPEEK
jgi:acetyl-CoA carboxylase biotin carboxyl carrier protein